MATFTLLEQADEDKLHATRLLGVEEKPFRRLTKRLLSSHSPGQAYANRPLATDEQTEPENLPSASEFQSSIARFRRDVLHDFAAFNTSIARIQFLMAANAAERERYAAEKLKIEATAQSVRENTARLRVQLDEAQRTLAVRKTYDVLALKITSDKALRPRDEQFGAIEKLSAEIEDLEREGRECEGAWMERRDMLGRVVNEGMRLRRLVRGEKEEPEVEVEQVEEEGADGMLDVEGEGDRGIRSGMGTPLPGTPRPVEDALTPMPAGDSGTMTPRSTAIAAGNGTPLMTMQAEGVDTTMADEGRIATKEEAKVKVVAPEEKVDDQMDIG